MAPMQLSAQPQQSIPTLTVQQTQNQVQQQQQQQQQPQQQPVQNQVQASQQVQSQVQNQAQTQAQPQAQFRPNYVQGFVQQNQNPNFQHMFAASQQQNSTIFAPTFTMAAPNLQAAQQQAGLVSNVYPQMTQQMNPQFLRALQQQINAHQQLSQQQQDQSQNQQQQQQQVVAIPNGMSQVTINGTNAMVAPQPIQRMAIPTQSNTIQVNPLKRPLSSQNQTSPKPIQPRATTSPALTPVTTAAMNVKVPHQVVSCSDTDNHTDTETLSSKNSKGSAKKQKSEVSLSDGEMTAQEKAKANRDRNREHARNTRLRKKAYLVKLKTTVDELCRERDTLVSERAGAANMLVQMHNTRTEVLMSFFSLRSCNEKRRQLWSSILDESCFQCIMPVTPYRSFPASEVQVSKCQRTILGIDGMISDTASLHVLFDSLVNRSKHPNGKVQFRYTLVTEDAVLAGNTLMARWTMSTVNAVELGARMEVSKHGMLCCRFNTAHKILALELMFDVMAFMLQLKQSIETESYTVIPNTTQTSQRPFDQPMVMTLAEHPYTIVQVNRKWENLTGYSAEEVVNKVTPRILQGPETNKNTVLELMEAIRFKRACQVSLLNYTKTGKKFINFFAVFPLSTDSKITHYLGLSHYVDMLDNEGASPAAKLPSIQQDGSSATEKKNSSLNTA
eukprot:CAMPEP_0178973470 /NCGR_PEP_ID=MMETSP0789-20121207/21750_1 /TAXON_ID=3005 /ORGANISM="Rhizosolenia setigera, Strain CCMP 1694" /LENGTH=671 /DNA_ID=CAMNT_0020661359 /DNA_START=1463 /DNA_END=3478 /DNA_ORIENTATION=-